MQGDAQFATQVLRPMGCTVNQTESSTTVVGPPRGTLRPIQEIDMETMTDAFLTASILAAVAHGPNGKSVTRITGIKNQQQKECERITAMRDQLAKFGVHSNYWLNGGKIDGIEIHGIDYTSLEKPSGGVDCYDDHRVAMSFSVLAMLAPHGALIRERECVGKTWPGWWDTVRRLFQVQMEGIDLEQPKKVAHQHSGASWPYAFLCNPTGG